MTKEISASLYDWYTLWRRFITFVNYKITLRQRKITFDWKSQKLWQCHDSIYRRFITLIYHRYEFQYHNDSYSLKFLRIQYKIKNLVTVSYKTLTELQNESKIDKVHHGQLYIVYLLAYTFYSYHTFNMVSLS